MRRGRVRAKKRRNKGLFLFIFLLIAIIAGAGFVYFSPLFEKEPPKIYAQDKIFANAKTPISVKIEDNKRVKSCKIVLKNSDKEIVVYSQDFLMPIKSKVINIKVPKDILKSSSSWDIVIEVRDGSFWNFFMGNKKSVTSKLVIDNQPPRLEIVANSVYILKGGSGLIIFKAVDENLKDVYVDVGKGIKFKPIRYKRDGVYATLFAWPFYMDEFNPKIVAIDSANNISKQSINIYKKYKKYRVSKIKATDKFINGKITQLANSDPEFAEISDKFKKFIAVNELMRKKNEDYIHRMSKKVTPFNGTWDIKPFYPLKGAKKVSDFGAKRFYYYDKPDNIISTSYHVGYDFASVKNANLVASNDGVVVSTKYNGIYGNMPLIDHGFGLYTLYGHCSTILVHTGDRVKAGDIIAKTGKTGLALGDHLHFGILIQGVEVYPLEWMGKKWIKDHITDIFKKADKNLGIIE